MFLQWVFVVLAVCGWSEGRGVNISKFSAQPDVSFPQACADVRLTFGAQTKGALHEVDIELARNNLVCPPEGSRIIDLAEDDLTTVLEVHLPVAYYLHLVGCLDKVRGPEHYRTLFFFDTYYEDTVTMHKGSEETKSKSLGKEAYLSSYPEASLLMGTGRLDLASPRWRRRGQSLPKWNPFVQERDQALTTRGRHLTTHGIEKSYVNLNELADPKRVPFGYPLFGLAYPPLRKYYNKVARLRAANRADSVEKNSPQGENRLRRGALVMPGLQEEGSFKNPTERAATFDVDQVVQLLKSENYDVTVIADGHDFNRERHLDREGNGSTFLEMLSTTDMFVTGHEGLGVLTSWFKGVHFMLHRGGDEVYGDHPEFPGFYTNAYFFWPRHSGQRLDYFFEDPERLLEAMKIFFIERKPTKALSL